MAGAADYVNVERITSKTGDVIVETVKVSAEGLAIILFEDQLYQVRETIVKRQAAICELERLLREDYDSMNKLQRTINELQNRRR